MTMTPRIPAVVAALLTGLLAATPAEAFRCGSKLVIDGMHEQQVVAICGEPATRRHLGYAVRPYELRRRHELGSGWSRGYWRGPGGLSEEVIITEYVYNFGPRKLMQRLIFEGGILVEIEPIGYGY
jgi:hypothetical protein